MTLHLNYLQVTYMSETHAQRLDILCRKFWTFECYEFPFMAIMAGVQPQEPELFREAVSDFERRAAQAQEMLNELTQISEDALVSDKKITLALLRQQLQLIVDRYRLNDHFRPSLFPAGPDFNTIYFANITQVTNRKDAQKYFDRLATIPNFVTDLQNCIQQGFEQGIRYPKVILMRAASAIRANLTSDGLSAPWYKPFSKVSPSTLQTIQDIADLTVKLIEDNITPAFEGYADFVDSLEPSGKESISCMDDPDGEAFYHMLVKRFTSTDMNAQEIHDLGKSEVVRLSKEIDEIIKEAGFDGNKQAYLDYLKNEPAFTDNDAETMQRNVQVICKEIDALIPAYFGYMPRITYGVNSIPEKLARSMPPAYAQPNPADGSHAGVFWITSIPENCPTYNYTAFSLHEAWPGHLMHIAIMQEQSSLPDFQRNSSLKYTANIEGWAVYCEWLGQEMGAYKTVHQQYGRLSSEIWRASRLVIDTGIHTMGWSRQQAIDYLAEYAPLSVEAVEAEVDRYIALPAQALAYQLGNITIRRLRTEIADALGDDFNIRAFHDAIVTLGPVTLDILEGSVKEKLLGKVT